jgi:hypothetical protein
MYRSPALFHPPSQARDRSSGRTGNPCLFCAPPHFSSRNAFWLPVGTLSSSFDDGGKRPLPHSTMPLSSFPTLFQIAWKYESTALLFFMPITIRSLLGVFDACTASHPSCIVLFCAAGNSITASMLGLAWTGSYVIEMVLDPCALF